MQLGNLFVDEIHNLFANQLLHLQQKKDRPVHLGFLETDLSESDRIFLNAAHTLYKESLLIIKEQQLGQNNKNLPIEKQWEKAQHLLLRSRAQFNIGRSLFELAQCDRDRRQGLTDASKMFEETILSCDKIPNFTLLIQNQSKSHEISHYDSSKTWEEHAMHQKFQSMELMIDAKNELGLCLWNLSRFADAETLLIEASKKAKDICPEGYKGADPFDIIHLLCNFQSTPLLLLDLAKQAIEIIPPKHKNAGEKFLKVARGAIERAIEISHDITALGEKYNLNKEQKFDEMLQNVRDGESLQAEESAIINCWKEKLSLHAENSKTGVLLKDQINYDGNRGELDLDLQRVSFQPSRRRILLSDSSSARHKRVAKKGNASFNASDAINKSFDSKFGDSPEVSTESSRVIFEPQQYMPWGDEMLNKDNRNKYPACCPPLPPDMPLDVRRSLEAKLGDVLLSNK